MYYLTDTIRRHALLQPDATAIQWGSEAISYGDFYRSINQLGHALLGAGAQRGDHIAVLGKNGPEYAIAYYGCAAAGTILTCVNYRLAGPELVHILEDSEARILLLDWEFVETWESIRDECSQIDRVILVGDQKRDDYEHFYAFIGSQPSSAPDIERDENDVALQMYTSGTTGVPKGAMLTHRNLIENMTSLALVVEEFDEEHGSYLICAPLYHMAAGLSTMLSFLLGMRVVLHREFNPPLVLQDIGEQRVTHTLLIPAMVLFLVQLPDAAKADFSSLKTITYGASPMPYEVLKKAMQVFGCDFAQGYGQTESSGVLTVLTEADHRVEGERGQEILKSAGREIPGVEVRVVDEKGAEVKNGEWGEVVGRGPNVMKGYSKMPEKTAETVREGWLWTGDIGYRDDEGYVYIVDRSKDMIISGGENIYPREIEEVLFAHEGLADAAVIGVPSDKGWGEDVKACVVLKPGTELAEAELIAFCRERLAGYKCPKSVDFIDAVPRNLSGKVLKKDLRAPYWEGRERGVN